MRYTIGVDLGFAKDYTAIVTLDREPRKVDGERIGEAFKREHHWVDHYRAVRVERMPLKTEYHNVVERVGQYKRRYPNSNIIVDATGVGLAVTQHLARDGVAHVPMLITGGHGYNTQKRPWSIAKAEIISKMLLVYGENRIHLSPTGESAHILRAELQDFRMKRTASGNEQYLGDWRVGAHDDLVLALGIAVWLAERSSTRHWWPDKNPPAPDHPQFQTYHAELEEKRLLAAAIRRYRPRRQLPGGFR